MFNLNTGHMVRSLQSLINYRIGATDGEIGHVKDFYFDDQTWRLRYLVVETGNWLIGRKVLISPAALSTPEWDGDSIPANLTTDQVKGSPDIDTEKPVSRQQEADLHHYYSWPGLGFPGGGFVTTGMVGAVVDPTTPLEDKIAMEAGEYDRHLRSYRDVVGLAVVDDSASLGKVTDMLADTANWSVVNIDVSVDETDAGKRMLLATADVEVIDSAESSIRVIKDRGNFADGFAAL